MTVSWHQYLKSSTRWSPLSSPTQSTRAKKSSAESNRRHFRVLLAANPSLNASQLLNSNNLQKFSSQADVVVGGGGIIGLIYAIHLKTIMPHLDIAVFEKSPSPQYKIGESTLSSFMRFLNTDVAGSEYLLRLFGVKDGLDFLWVDENGSRPIPQDIGNLDVSYQLDRRVSDLFLTMWAQRLGVRVYHGVDVDYEVEIPVDGHPTESAVRAIRLKDSGDSLGGETTVEARYVCDASGFGCRLTSKVGAKEHFSGWNTDAVWAYFKPLECLGGEEDDDELLDWDYASTKHICFPEGWGWFIKLISWHQAPLANLMDMLAYFIDLAMLRTPVEEMPSTSDLSSQFDCPFEFITSIGWAIRDDAPKPPAFPGDGSLGDSERRFLAIQKKYPLLDKLMTKRYKLLPGYYDGRTYFVRKQLSFQRPVVAGHKWFAVGNATGFTNPLISPGINVGLLGAVKSAEMTASCLQAEDHADPAFAQRVQRDLRDEYQQYIHDYVMPRLHMMNRLWYNSFRDGRLFEAVIVCFWVVGSTNRSYLSYHFGASDFEWVVGSGTQAFAEFSDEILPLIEGPCDGIPVADDVADRVQTICRRWLDEMVAKYPQPWSSNQRHYNDRLERVAGKKSRSRGHFYLMRCPQCRYWNTPKLPACQICGHERNVCKN